ncbi:trihelix transcription factor GT-2-like [Vigna unguiculata]|uniref:Myb-like domain-containing protein n=1 Tax=Vigna unguiculata TaxID=3917 RepID=A0A4D6M1T4_VIGUN|nr:trihelix transcription factor GT-2-like [Vigna unguiculata]QCD94568.1 hypothetical protein DEO72_LG5g2652 [Vigna unguiculata]
MLGDSAVLGTGGGGGSGDAVVAAGGGAAHDGAVDVAGGGGGGGGGGSNSGDDERGRVEEGDRSFGGNRWPRQETLALLKIRSDMDVAFRDASVKGPLWEEVSRKLADLGYHRNAKKCKEKFENVYKYHKRTKEGRTGKSEGKTYRFFDQLQALENNPAIHAIQSPTPVTTTALPATPVSIVVTTTPSSIMSLPPTTTLPLPPVSNNTTVPSPTTLPVPQAILALTTTPSFPSSNPTTYFPTQTPNPTTNNNNNKNPLSTITPPSFPNIPTDLLSNSSSSSTSSEETTTEGGRRKRKRKWKDFFERLMKEVIEKQEELQRRFLEAIERREQERVAREEAWRMQEMQRINREREILAQERSIAAAKDAAVMAFLQKMAEHQQEENNLQPALNTNNNNNSITIAPQQPVPQATPTPTPAPQQKQTTTVAEAPPVQSLVPQQQQHQVQQQQQLVLTNVESNKADNNGENLMMGASSSRWPKVEVQALIDLRTNLETKYQENGPKGPLWEEISALMRKMGYNRNAKRCKEKWENINKYFKKVKESNKKRPEDSKTCPYFHQLEALYKEKNKGEGQMKPESMMAPLMVQPEQQWPPQQVVPPEVTMEDAQNDPMDARHHEDAEEEEEEEDKDIGEEDDDEDDEGGNYEIVASKPAPTPASAGDASAE